VPSQLFTNDKIKFLACKPFTYRGTPYEMGDEFPQEEANNIETMVRSRFVIPYVDDIKDKPRHWHGHIRTKEQAEEYLNRDRVQLVWPSPPDSDEVVNMERLVRPETTPSGDELAEEQKERAEATEEPDTPPPAEAVHVDEYDPSYHTVVEVKAYLAEHPEERERVLEMEEAGRGRKGILEE